MPPVRKPAAARKSAAARAEVNGSQKTLKFEGLTLKLPSKIPFRAMRNIDQSGIAGDVGFLRDIIGEEQMEKVWALDIDVDRGQELLSEVLAAYGADAGE